MQTTTSFHIDIQAVRLLNALMEACERGSRTWLVYPDGTEWSGIARVVVSSDDLSSAWDRLTPECRLHLSGVGELWVRLRGIDGWHWYEGELWLEVDPDAAK